MGDVRFQHAYARVERADDRTRVVQNMATDELVMALAATAGKRDPFLVDVIATELHNRVRRTTAAIESIAEGVIIVDPSGAITYANPTALRLVGHAAHEIAGMSAAEFRLLDAEGVRIPWRERPACRALELGETVATRGARIERADGSSFPISILAAPIRADGAIVGAVVAFRDITEELRAGEERHLRGQLLDALPEAVVATTLAGRIIYWNAGAERLYGWAADEVMDRDIVDVTPAESSREEAAAIMARLQQGGTWSGEFPVRGRAGAPFLARVTNAPILDASGRLVGVIGISRPVTAK